MSQEIIEAVRAQVPAVPPAWTDADFTRTERIIEGQDLAGMMGLKRVIHETDLTLTPRRPSTRLTGAPGWYSASALSVATSSVPRSVSTRYSTPCPR